MSENLLVLCFVVEFIRLLQSNCLSTAVNIEIQNFIYNDDEKINEHRGGRQCECVFVILQHYWHR